MGFLVPILLKYGYAGMFISAFLAGSILPFSSEVVLAALRLAGLGLWPLVIYATLGNTLGGMLNYAIGRIGNENWAYRMLKIKENKLERTKVKVRKYGAWMGLLSWLPVIGELFTVAMGLLHVNVWKSGFAVFLGKFARYVILAFVLKQF